MNIAAASDPWNSQEGPGALWSGGPSPGQLYQFPGPSRSLKDTNESQRTL